MRLGVPLRMTPVPVRSPPRAPLDEGVRLRHRHLQRVTVLEPAQRRDALQRPRHGGQPRHERPDQRPAREAAVSRQPSAVSRQQGNEEEPGERRLRPRAQPVEQIPLEGVPAVAEVLELHLGTIARGAVGCQPCDGMVRQARIR